MNNKSDKSLSKEERSSLRAENARTREIARLEKREAKLKKMGVPDGKTQEILSGFKFKCYPTEKQKGLLYKEFGCSKFIYNWATHLQNQLFEATAEYTEVTKFDKKTQKDKIVKQYVPGSAKSFTPNEFSILITGKRQDLDWLGDGSRYVQSQALGDVFDAYSKFFKNPKHFDKPKEKNKYAKKSCTYQVDRVTKINQNSIRVSTRIGFIKFENSYFEQIWENDHLVPDKNTPLVINPKMVTFSVDACGQFWFSCNQYREFELYEENGEFVASDSGIKTNQVLSNGEELHLNPKLKGLRKYLKKYQSIASKAEKGSKRGAKKRKRVNKTYAKITNIVEDQHHKLSTDLVTRYQYIVMEDLNLTGMVKNHKLARALSEQKIGGFVAKLKYKCTRHGRTYLEIPRFFPSSKLCSHCGYKNQGLTLKIREWTCPDCGVTHDRDLNAAYNIELYGRYMIEYKIPVGDGKFTNVDLENYRCWLRSKSTGRGNLEKSGLNEALNVGFMNKSGHDVLTYSVAN